MKSLLLVLVALELITGAFGTIEKSSEVEKRQWYGFGCGQSLPTIGNYCYQPVQDGTVVCRGICNWCRVIIFYRIENVDIVIMLIIKKLIL